MSVGPNGGRESRRLVIHRRTDSINTYIEDNGSQDSH